MKKIMSVVLALVLVSALSVSALAAGSVVAPIVKDYEGGSATISQDTTSGDSNVFTFTAEAKEGYNFVGWEIDGNYEIVSGSLESETVTVKFLDVITINDIIAEPVFELIEEDDTEPTEDNTVDATKPTTTATSTTKKHDTSPSTGDSMAVLALATAALAGVVISKKKLSK